MSGKKHREKGSRLERLAVHLFQNAGVSSERVPLSGAAGGSFNSDVSVAVQGEDRKFECKARANGFKQLYDWLPGNYGLVLKADRREPLVVLRISDFAELARRR